MHLIIVEAKWDNEAHVWVAESPTLPGLITEADTLELLQQRLPTVIEDLLAEKLGDEEVSNEPTEIPVSLIAHAASSVTIRRVPRG
jgi:predicted RNase H-like HicB family nuclease